MNQWKSGFAIKTKARSLADALVDADVFFGLSVKGAVTQDMVKSMAAKPDHLRDGQSRSRNHRRRGRGRARGRHHGDRPLGLPEPDQ
jgi:Malic enzyme